MGSPDHEKKMERVILWLVIGVVLFAFFVPVIRYDSNVSPACSRQRIPCPLVVHDQYSSGVYWSVTAYGIGLGTFLVPFSEYGIA